MNKMKKLLALVLVLTLVLTLTACGSAAKPADTETTAPSTEAPATEPPATEAPTTQPVTEAPTTEAPTTEAPTTEAAPEPVDDEVFAAIGNPAIDPDAVGTWVYVLDYGKLMEATASEQNPEELDEMTQSLMGIYDGLTMDVLLDLRADGTLTFGFDEESARAAVEVIISKMGEVLIPMFASMMGVSEEEMMQQLEDAGMTVDDLLEQMMGQMDPEEMVASITESTREGYWRYVDGKLYIVEEGDTVNPDQFVTVELGDGVLTMTEMPDDGEGEGEGEDEDDMSGFEAMMPMEFTRK